MPQPGGAVEQITKVPAKELGHRKNSVNAISPGPVDTELFRHGQSEEQIPLICFKMYCVYIIIINA